MRIFVAIMAFNSVGTTQYMYYTPRNDVANS